MWSDLLSGNYNDAVVLRNFYLTEWIPLSPGLYFTPDASESRKYAKKSYKIFSREYLPLGKSYMVLGGIGCLRLKPRKINNKDYFILGATANGIAHEGIPVLCTEDIYLNLINGIKENGKINVDLKGTVQLLPIEKAIIKQDDRYHKECPKFCIVLSDLSIKNSIFPKSLYITIAITFSAYYSNYSLGYFAHKGKLHRLEKSWSFCTFTPDPYGRNLKQGVEWLLGYTKRYSESKVPPIFNDFDELFEHFPNATEFPLNKIGTNNIDAELLAKYAEYYGFQVNINEIIVGDKFENIYNSNIVNRSNLHKAYNKINWLDWEFTKKTNDGYGNDLLEIENLITTRGEENAAKVFNELVSGVEEQPQIDKGFILLKLNELVNYVPEVGKTSLYEKIIQFKNTDVGDNFSNIQNSTVINRSLVEASFNKIKKDFDTETASVLLEVAKIVEGSGNKEAGALYDAFNEEIKKPEPQKPLLKFFWPSLSTLLPVLATTAGIVEKVIKIIG